MCPPAPWAMTAELPAVIPKAKSAATISKTLRRLITYPFPPHVRDLPNRSKAQDSSSLQVFYESAFHQFIDVRRVDELAGIRFPGLGIFGGFLIEDGLDLVDTRNRRKLEVALGIHIVGIRQNLGVIHPGVLLQHSETVVFLCLHPVNAVDDGPQETADNFLVGAHVRFSGDVVGRRVA